MPIDHTYEELRGVLCDVLAGRERTNHTPDHYSKLEGAVAEVFYRREKRTVEESLLHQGPYLSPLDADLFMEVFWDLFRQGIITLGHNRANQAFPWCRLSRFGKVIIQNQDVYFFHDVSTYEALIKSQVPKIDPTTMVYLKEAMQAYRSGCMLSATVMLGVAAEHTFSVLLETIDANATNKAAYAGVHKERSILRKLNKFRPILEKQLASLANEVREDLDTQFAGIQSVIRNFRNESGHPTGQIIDREQVYVLLNLAIPYLKKMYQLIDHFS